MVDKTQDVDVDKILEKLLDVRGSKPGKQVNLTESEIKGLIAKSRDIFINQPMLLELEAPIKICGSNNTKKTLLFLIISFLFICHFNFFIFVNFFIHDFINF